VRLRPRIYSGVPPESRPHIVVLTAFLPWPLTSGGQVRQYHLLDVARRRGRVTLLADFPDWGTPAERAELAVRWPDVTVGPSSATAADGADPYVSKPRGHVRLGARSIRAKLDPRRSKLRTWKHPAVERALTEALADSAKLLQIEFVQSARYVPATTPCPVLLVAHDVVTRRDREARRVGGAHEHVELGGMRARLHERAAFRRADMVVVTSDEDATEALRLGANHVELVPNGADDRLTAIPVGGAADRLLFVGAAIHEPNVDAVMWWNREIVPRAPDLPPLRVAGSGWDAFPPMSGVEYLGFVPDLDALLGSSVIVAPLRVGGGTKLKMIEAMAAGRPIAATPAAAAGLPIVPGKEALVERTPDALAEAIRRLLRDAELRRTLGEAARAAVQDLLWSRVATRMDAVYDRLLSDR